MIPRVAKLVHGSSVAAAGLGAVLSPIPLADEVLLFPLFAGLAVGIGKAHGLAAQEVPWRPVLRTAFNGLLARAGLNLAVAYIPGVAAVANAISAAALTELFGHFVDESCADPANARPMGVKDVAALLREKAKAYAPGPA
jgi:uncharacterized protein (DUF697 family)